MFVSFREGVVMAGIESSMLHKIESNFFKNLIGCFPSRIYYLLWGNENANSLTVPNTIVSLPENHAPLPHPPFFFLKKEKIMCSFSSHVHHRRHVHFTGVNRGLSELQRGPPNLQGRKGVYLEHSGKAELLLGKHSGRNSSFPAFMITGDATGLD